MIPVREYSKAALSLNRPLGLLIVGLFSVLLVACGGEEGDDLDQYMRNAAKDIKPKIKPLPEVKSYTVMQYNADGILSDPFRARKAISKSNTLQPNLNRPKEPMEAYPLESLKYVGLLAKAKLTYALIKTPDNAVQQVKLGNYIGQNFGRVMQINDNEVLLKEIVQDDLSGEWIERDTRLELQE